MSFRHSFNLHLLSFILSFVLALLWLRIANGQLTSKQPQLPNFLAVAGNAGLTMTNVFGGLETKKYIIETTGTGVAIFDYDNDGWPDIFFVNGTTLDGKASTNHLYHNNH